MKKGNYFIAGFFPCLLVLAIASSAIGIAWGKEAEDRGYILNVGSLMPGFSTKTTDGKDIRLSDLKGKVVMLQFTASWCIVCRNEMPHIEKEIWQRFRDRSDFALLGIDLDEPLEKVRDFATQMSISYPLALDPGGKIFQLVARNGAGVTRNVLIDRRGRIIFLTRLFDDKEFQNLKERIAKELGS